MRAGRLNENKTDIRVVRPVDRSILGQEESLLVPLSITDDRTYGEDWEALKIQADIVIKVRND